MVWAAGIKAPDFLRGLAGLESNRINQLVVMPTLQATRDENIFALGDCAACPWPQGSGWVPPRAQAAHQQASHLFKMLPRHLEGRRLQPFRYRDFGSLISLGRFSTVGSLMGAITRGSVMVEGWFAGLVYRSLYRMHQYALHGFSQVALDTPGAPDHAAHRSPREASLGDVAGSEAWGQGEVASAPIESPRGVARRQHDSCELAAVMGGYPSGSR